MGSVKAQLLAPQCRPYYVLIISVLTAIYLVITGLVVDNRYESKLQGPTSSTSDKTVGAFDILAVILLIVTLMLIFMAIFVDQKRKLVNLICFVLLTVTLAITLGTTYSLQANTHTPIPAMPTPFCAIMAAMVAVFLSLMILILPCLEARQ
ncbi:hypothetical protein CSKR_101827 [Clonorchis sinensis]|uniref:Uncharacterized protein n=2 Tax=Clonorchis sinensis TaxID=79923 RepID=A0A8T1M6H6_CLOSI|nr:hypothetical protein CSKR_101827 [Clonorchis sinensis]GAA52968.1 hypothetical protein CLF_109240 [Clonorchis sinensis]